MIEMKHIAMLIAERAAMKSNCNKRKVAFVVFNSKAILAVSMNKHTVDKPCQCVAGIHDPDVTHAEDVIKGQVFEDAQAVITYAPCLTCANDLTPSGINKIHVKQVKHQAGVNHLNKNGIATHHEWLSEKQRIQAAWLLKWVYRQYEEYL